MSVCVCEKGVYQYFHVCFRVEARRDESLVLCELVQHGLTQDGLYNGGGGGGGGEVWGGEEVEVEGGEEVEVGGGKEEGEEEGRRWERRWGRREVTGHNAEGKRPVSNC